MVKKLFMLFSIGMTGYTFYVIKVRPGMMFKRPIESITVEREESEYEEIEQDSGMSVEEENMAVTIYRGSGDVLIKRGNRELSAEEGMPLKINDLIYTGRDSVAVLKFAGNSLIKVFSSSQFKIERIQGQSRSDSGTQYNIFYLKKGAVLVDFINRGKMHFLEMLSDSGKLQIKGTQFLLIHNPSKERSQLAVLEGLVKASSNGVAKTKYVGSSQGLLIKGNTELSAPVETGWVQKINWLKFGNGTGMDLYDPTGTPEEIEQWKKRRAELQKMPISMKVADRAERAGKTKAGSLIKNVVGKVLEVGGDIASKGVNKVKQGSPVGQLNEAAEAMKNVEKSRAERKNALENIGDL